MISESMGADKAWLERPRLRPVELLPFSGPDGDALVLRDPLRIAEQPVFLAPAAIAILPLLDGDNDLRDIQAVLLREYGQLVEIEAIRNLVLTLDERLYLEGDTFEERYELETERFAALTVRPAALAGQAYPDDPGELAALLGSYYLHESGPGSPLPETNAGPPAGLVAPHIDFARGGPCYAWAFRTLRDSEPPDHVVILGVAHGPTAGAIGLCAKDFDTPFGPTRLDVAGAEAVLDAADGAVSVDELVHRGEHSAEFMAVWLQSRLADHPETRVLPFLCGSFQELIEDGRNPEEDPEYVRAADALKAYVDQCRTEGRRVLVLCGADLSHVGPQFDDDFEVTPLVAREIERRDREILGFAEKGDYRGFFQAVARDRDQTHICGLSAIYTLLRILGGPPGRLLAYQQWIDPDGQGLVSFAGLSFG